MYNLDFLIAALVFLIFILCHFLSQRRLQTVSSRIFWLCLILALTDVSLDLLTSILIGNQIVEVSMIGTAKFFLTAFYLVQVMVPYVLLFYAHSLYKSPKDIRESRMILKAVPAMIFAFLVLMNVKTGWFFRFSELGVYQKGPYYFGMYLYALMYGGMMAVMSLIHRKEMGARGFSVVWEFLIIMVPCVLVQYWNGRMLLTGFGIAMGTMLIYLLMNNPSDQKDHLTNLFDFICFHQWVDSQFEWKKRFHVLTVDIWQLKRINMIFGTSCGDELLKRVAKELRGMDEQAYVFRVSGKRFVMILESISSYERVKEKMQSLFSETFYIDENPIPFSAVICGVMNAERLENGDNLMAYIEYLVSLAPQAENYVMIQDTPGTMQGYIYQQEVERFLKTAIEEDLFEVRYQPVYSLEKGDYITLEALSRLRHPSLGMISPEVFISIAEQSGQISQIGYLQFRKVARFLSEHREIMEKIQNVKFNVSPAELLKKEYIGKLLEILKEYEIPPSWIQLEITETVATEYIDRLYSSVAEIRKAGICLCLDDFGSGFANLNTVLKLPFSVIKLDRSMLYGILAYTKIAEFYRQMVSVLKSLGYSVIAEGVEAKEEVELLSRWGVDMIQGYYFSKPVTEEEIVKLCCKEPD